MQGQPDTATASTSPSTPTTPASPLSGTGAGLPRSSGLFLRSVRRHWVGILLAWAVAATGIVLWQYHLLDLSLVSRRAVILAASLIGTLALIAAAFAFVEARSERVTNPDEFTRRSGIPVLGAITPLPPYRGPGRARQAAEEFSQSLDHLIVAFTCGHPRRDRHCILLASAEPGEGKTTLAAQLGGRCANAGMQTLLIDGDLRRAALNRLLEVPRHPGLAEVLRGEVGPEYAISPIRGVDGLCLMPAGGVTRHPIRLLHSAAFGELIGRLRDTFDVVLIDTPPLLTFCDALLMGKWADGAVLVTLRGKSRLPMVERAARRLAHVGVPVLGAVINGDRSSGATYGGYRYSSSEPLDE